jgi:hypothetical protein
MMKKLFTERHGEGKARVADILDDATREGLLTLVSARIDEEWFGLSFNEKCSDGYAYAGTDLTRLGRTMTGYGIIWPHDVDRDNPPNDGQIFDLLEFSYEFIAEAKDPHYHSYMSHSHYSYDREAGRAKFTQDVNRMYERNGIASSSETARSSGSPRRFFRKLSPEPLSARAIHCSTKCSKRPATKS